MESFPIAEIHRLIQYVDKRRVIERSAPEEVIRKRDYGAPVRQDLEGAGQSMKEQPG